MAENSAISENRLDFGKLQYGCVHYKRRCRIRAPCCNRVFSCRHCHNEAVTSLSNPNEEHELVRSEITQVICAVCDTEQPVAKVCSSCGVNMGEYFCEICKFYDDESQKKHFHCNECGVCRVGGREKFFHCSKCGCCCSTGMRDNHECVQDVLKIFCPICYEYLFESIKILRHMGCGHIIHRECFDNMLNKKQYRCPICSKAVVDMSLYWEILDEEIGATTMPAEYQYENRPILRSYPTIRSHLMISILRRIPILTTLITTISAIFALLVGYFRKCKHSSMILTSIWGDVIGNLYMLFFYTTYGWN